VLQKPNIQPPIPAPERISSLGRAQAFAIMAPASDPEVPRGISGAPRGTIETAIDLQPKGDAKMQKKLIAVAVAGLLSGAAFAQSNVTVYGVADATFDMVKVSGTGTTEPNHNRVSSNSSYLGFKGVEDVGNGLKAVFQFEGGVNTSSGAGYSFDRDTFVGLAGGFGTVAMGNLTGPTRALGASVDVFTGATGIGVNAGIIGKFGGALTGVTVDANTNPTVAAVGRSSTQVSPFDTRWKNAIAYISPSFSGVTATIAYVANENKSNTINTSGWDMGVKYDNGPIMVGLTYNPASVRNNTPVLGMVDIKMADTRLGASYDFGAAKILGLYDRVKVKATGFDEHQTVWGLGVQVPVGAGKIVGQYYKANDISGTGNDNTGGKLYTLGYEHSLSKRTILKATYARITSDKNSAYSFGVNGTTGGAVADSTSSGIQVGIRHSF
jgi:predicted porin